MQRLKDFLGTIVLLAIVGLGYVWDDDADRE